jgi:hypothetical protein
MIYDLRDPSESFQLPAAATQQAISGSGLSVPSPFQPFQAPLAKPQA